MMRIRVGTIPSLWMISIDGCVRMFVRMVLILMRLMRTGI